VGSTLYPDLVCTVHLFNPVLQLLYSEGWDLICANFDSQSVEHEIVLWEPKIKENSPGEVINSKLSIIIYLSLYHSNVQF
jgi:hypothetical protein